MFSVFSKSGRIFSGSMEELGKVDSIAMMTRNSRGARSVHREARQSPEWGAPERHPEQTPEHEAADAGRDLAHRTAVAAYAQTEHVDTQRHPLTQVVDIMSNQVVSIVDTVPLGEAWATLSEHAFGQAPVVDSDGVLVGLLSRAALMRPDRLPGPTTHPLVWRALLLQPASDFMVTPVPSVESSTDIRRVARVLLDTGLPGLPVVDDAGRVRGFVSRTDILRAVVADPPLDLWS